MTDSYKILGQAIAEDIEPNTGENQARIVYTVPENTQSSISAISILNTSAASDASYSLGVVKSDDVSSSFVPGTLSTLPFSTGPSYSVDGLSWQSSINTTGQSFSSSSTSVATDGERFYAATSSTSSRKLLISDDGITWGLVDIPLSSYNRVAATSERVLISGTFSSSTLVAYSTDRGLTWATSNRPAFQISGLYAINNIFLGLPDNGTTLSYSADGITWSTSTLPFSAQWSGATYFNGLYILSTGNSSNQIVYSSDLVSWSTATLPVSNIWRALTSSDNIAVALSMANPPTGAYSLNGSEWIGFSMPSTYVQYNKVSYGKGIFVAIPASGSNGATSVDGINWTLQASFPAGNNLVHDLKKPLFDILMSQTIIPDRTLSPGEVNEIFGGISLSSGDQIRVYSESTDISVHVYGVEIA